MDAAERKSSPSGRGILDQKLDHRGTLLKGARRVGMKQVDEPATSP